MRPINFRVRLLALAAAALLLSMIMTRVASAAPPAPPAKITAGALKPRRHTLRAGTAVSTSELVGVRVFPNATHGFALANVNDAQYPAATVDGGKTWRTDGPVLHENAAQAPLGVLDVGAANKHTFFAFGGGQVVDVTSDAGKRWWQALLGDGVLSVVAYGSRLVAVVQDATGSDDTARTVVYVSRDGGHHWRLNDTLGAS